MRYNTKTLQHRLSGVIVICIALIAYTSPVAYGYDDAGIGSNISIRPEDRASFALSEYSYEVRCATRVVIIHWESSEEDNLTNYRIHRRTVVQDSDSTQSYTDSTWVTPTHIVARGSNNTYKIVDAQIAMGTTYNYRLYGYGSNLKLSEAQNLPLDQTMTPSCLCLPLIYQ